MASIHFKLEQEACILCEACIHDCPSRIIRMDEGFPGIRAADEAQCIRCQHCLAVCPTGAISILGLNPSDSLPLGETPEIDPDALGRFVRGRRTVRQYRPESVDRAVLERLLADTAHAPTGGNTCDLTLTVIDNRPRLAALLDHVIDAVERALQSGAALPEFMADAVRQYRETQRDELFRGAPHLLIASAGEKAYCGDADVVIALSYFEFLAHARGLGTMWCDFLKFIFDAVPGTAALFGIPTDRPYRAMVFGHPAVRFARTVQRDHAARVVYG